MNYQIQQIAARLLGLREALELSMEDIAKKCAISPSEYESYESGKVDIPMSFLFQMAQSYGIDITDLLSGESARTSAFYVTRKGTGLSMERTKAYKYQALASGFKGAKAEPFEVTVEPNNDPVHLNTHAGQEFNMVLEGTMELHIAGNKIILEKGDSIYFDASKPHGMRALKEEKVVFLAIIV